MILANSKTRCERLDIGSNHHSTFPTPPQESLLFLLVNHPLWKCFRQAQMRVPDPRTWRADQFDLTKSYNVLQPTLEKNINQPILANNTHFNKVNILKNENIQVRMMDQMDNYDVWFKFGFIFGNIAKFVISSIADLKDFIVLSKFLEIHKIRTKGAKGLIYSYK